MSAIAYRARASHQAKRSPMMLESMHTLDVVLSQRSNASMMRVEACSYQRVRTHVIEHFDRLAAAGMVLRWVRQATAYREPEPLLWHRLMGFLDELNEPVLGAHPTALVISSGMALLDCLGYGLALDRCVVCSKACPSHRSAYFDALRGGIVCRACGSGAVVLSASQRGRLSQCLHAPQALVQEDHAMGLAILEQALAAHMQVGDGAAGGWAPAARGA